MIANSEGSNSKPAMGGGFNIGGGGTSGLFGAQGSNSAMVGGGMA